MIKLITHNDLDGIGCYVVARYFLEEEIDVSYCRYNNVNEVALEVIKNENKYEKIFITDISVNEEVAEKLNTIGDKVTLLDHHPTAEFLNKYEWANVRTEQYNGKTCGTSLLFRLLESESEITNTMFSFVELVRRYDTWEWKDKYNDDIAKKLNDLMYVIGKETFIKNMIEKVENNYDLFSLLDETILELRQKEIDRYIEKKDKNIIVQDILGYKAGIVFADNFISELGNRLSELHRELDFIAMINQETVSYRTIKDDVNLSEVAKHFGGGGHPKASGSQISNESIDKFIDILFRS